MDGLRRLLERDGAAFSEDERAEIVKLLWLLGQVSDITRNKAQNSLRPLLKAERLDKKAFMRAVREVTRDTEERYRQLQALDRKPEDT